MTIRRPARVRHGPPIAAWLWARLRDEPCPAAASRWHQYFFAYAENFGLQAAWEAHRDEILADWAEHSPGTRPTCFWRFDAPAHRPPGETEDAFLRRHGLLLPGELTRSTAATD